MNGGNSHNRIRVTSGSKAHGPITTVLALLLALWVPTAAAVGIPVLSISVNGAPEVSFENDTVCDGTTEVLCYGVASVGDLLVSSFELRAGEQPYLAGSFNFYNASTTDTLSVVATVLLPLTGTLSNPLASAGSGIMNNVFGGGILNLQVLGFVDEPLLPLLTLDALPGYPGTPFSVCDNFTVDPDCQNTILSIAGGTSVPGDLAISSAIGLRLSFDLTADTTATIGLDPGGAYGGGAYFSLASQSAVPVPAAAWLLMSALGVLGGLRSLTRVK